MLSFITQDRVIRKILEHCVPRMHTSTLERRKRQQCCKEDEGRPLGIGLQGQVPNRPKLLWSKARVVSIGAGRVDFLSLFLAFCCDKVATMNKDKDGQHEDLVF
jgi:hypothetical protein